jgi:transposase
MARRYSQTQVDRIVAQAVAQATAPLLERIAELEAQVAQLKKNSSTSSKPPSSDLVKPKPKPTPGSKGKGKRKRRRGGQPGHDKHERKPFGPDEIDDAYDYELTEPGDLIPLEDWRIVQQVELIERPFVITEHRARRYRCPRTGRITTAPLPDEIERGGMVGPRLWAYIAYLKGGCRMSYTLIQQMLQDVMGLTLSTGELAKLVNKASAALAPAHEQLLEALPTQDHLGVDETGHKDQGKSMWTWCFRARRFAAYRIMDSRGCDVLRDTLGEDFAGVIGCDYFSAYRSFLKQIPGTMQFCHAHLIRDVKFLTTLTDACVKRWANKLLDALGKLFDVWHRRGTLTPRGFTRSARRARENVLKIARRPPPRAQAQTLATRFKAHGRLYFTFLERQGVEPTNNQTERSLRWVVIDRKLTQGTRGRRGQRWCERFWSVRETCRLQNRSAFAFLADAMHAHLTLSSPPLLL